MEEMLNAVVGAVVNCFRGGGKLLLCGNGGSAADCAHITGELVKGFLKRRALPEALCRDIGEPWADQLQMGLPAIDLTCHSALIAAVVNDLDGANMFAQQLMAYGRPGDVLIGISTSGNAENVRRAVVAAKALGLTTVGMTGRSGGALKGLCDYLLNVDQEETYRVQELHLPLHHQLCARVEETLFQS
jgi:D-sedoheptulose 7-phosphate isomerase